MKETSLRALRWKKVVGFAAALGVTPFLITGFYRAVDFGAIFTGLSYNLPFALFFVVGLALWQWPPRPEVIRAFGLGLAIGTVVFGIFLFWLLSQIARELPRIG